MLLGDRGETANVGEEHRHLAVAAVEQGRVAVQCGGQVGREELLELHPPAALPAPRFAAGRSPAATAAASTWVNCASSGRISSAVPAPRRVP